MRIKHPLSRRQARKWAFREGRRAFLDWEGPNGDGSFGSLSLEFIEQQMIQDCCDSWFINPRHSAAAIRSWDAGWRFQSS
jgi:hypothetical protein